MDQYLANGKATNEDLCRRCPQAAGKTTEAECRDALVLTGDEEQCVRRVFEANAQALEPYLSCLLKDYAAQYRACINERTCDSQLVATCAQSASAALEACGQTPTAAFEQVSARFK